MPKRSLMRLDRHVHVVADRLIALQVLAARRADLQQRDAAAPLGMVFEHALERLDPLGDALGVIEPIDAEDQPASPSPSRSRVWRTSASRVRPFGSLRPRLRVDADRKRLDVGPVPAPDDGEVLAVDPGLDAGVDRVEEVVAVELDVEAQQVVAEQAVDDLLAPRADAERLAVRPGNVPELADDRIGPRLLDEPRQQREVVVLHEDDRALVADLVDDRVARIAG